MHWSRSWSYTDHEKKKKFFSRIISSCQFLPKKSIYKELSKISQVQELGLSVSILYRHKASLIPWAHTILTGHKSFWAWKWYGILSFLVLWLCSKTTFIKLSWVRSFFRGNRRNSERLLWKHLHIHIPVLEVMIPSVLQGSKGQILKLRNSTKISAAGNHHHI